MKDAETIRQKLRENISKENVAVEIKYFEPKYNKSFERTYGWAWMLKLAEEIHTWDDPLATELEENLNPLVSIIAYIKLEWLKQRTIY